MAKIITDNHKGTIVLLVLPSPKSLGNPFLLNTNGGFETINKIKKNKNSIIDINGTLLRMKFLIIILKYYIKILY
jgi:hypothetical protein